MSETVGRVLSLLIGVAAGAAVGGIAGALLGSAGWGALAGAVAGLGFAGTLDAMRAERLLRWLRRAQIQPQALDAPRDAGLWGEVGYRMERSLRQREHETSVERERLRQFLQAIEASPNGVLLLDADDRIEWCNARAADHFGLDPARDQRQIVTNLLRAPAFVKHLQDGNFEAPVEIAGARGRASISVLVRPYGAGQKLLLSQDVTDRERMESMRRDFVANVSHEIRTPLTVLAGFVETLATVPLSATERPRVLELMRQQTTRIQNLVDDLLTLAQLEGSPRPPSDQWVKADTLLARATSDAQMLSAGRHEFTLDIQPGIELAGTEAELSSAIGNLLGNAVRYTPDGGRITVRLALREGSAVFEVRDNGIGIAREHLPRLTERFYRVDGSRSRETGGTGLGLAIVKHVVGRHGGELEIESEPGRGSTFRLVLPAARVRARAPAAGDAAALKASVAAAPASAHPDR